jgi:hypothetical protein
MNKKKLNLNVATPTATVVGTVAANKILPINGNTFRRHFLNFALITLD